MTKKHWVIDTGYKSHRQTSKGDFEQLDSTLQFRWVSARNGKAVAVGLNNYDLYVWDENFGSWEIPKWIEGKIDFYSCKINWEDEIYCNQSNGYLWHIDLENEK